MVLQPQANATLEMERRHARHNGNDMSGGEQACKRNKTAIW